MSLAFPGELWGSGVTYVGNMADHQGGAIYNSTGDAWFGDGSSWTGNTAVFGGGAIYNKLATLEIENSWFGFGNSAGVGVGDLIADDASDAIIVDPFTVQVFDRPFAELIEIV